ncbi:MAG: DsbC family protein [Comamonadaceae bacterium]|nr:MAG: DsbC family protein [Comamonadaceae bacterium]
MTRTKNALLALCLLAAGTAGAQEATIRKNLAERTPQLGAIDEVSKAPIAGLYEVRIGSDLFYTDAEGNYLIVQGQILDTRQRRNLTQERVDKLSAIDFAALPWKDSFTIVRGNGKRKVALFEDPNCGYCKRFERDLQKVDNVTIHVFLYPILGEDSVVKSRNIWCSRDQGRAWQDWMVRDKAAQPAGAPGCDTTALDRNRELGRRHQITGTPTLVFTDGRRVPGAIGASEVEKLLADAK